MSVRLRSLRACGEFVAILIGLSGAALCVALTTAPPTPDLASSQVYEVELVDARGSDREPDRQVVSCERAYSTALSEVEVFDRPADVMSACQSRQVIDLETAVCFAEEHYLGEGQARMAHFEIDERVHTPVWVIMGAEGEVVAVAAQ